MTSLPNPPLALPTLVALITLLGGCADQSPPETGSTENATAVVESVGLDAYLLATKPEGAISVTEARVQAQPGEPIVVTGQIGAVMHPFGEHFATLVLGDTGILYCDEMGDDDHCETPWDACCEDPDKIAVGRASVQLVSADGQPVPGSLRSVGGLSELDHIVVAGTVDSSSTPENLIINASGIYRQTP